MIGAEAIPVEYWNLCEMVVQVLFGVWHSLTRSSGQLASDVGGGNGGPLRAAKGNHGDVFIKSGASREQWPPTWRPLSDSDR